jgi:hypothetical protein
MLLRLVDEVSVSHALGVRELQTHIGGRPARLALQGIQFGRGDAAVPRSFLTTYFGPRTE